MASFNVSILFETPPQIEVFPNNLINTMTLSKKAIRPFRDNLATDNFDYKPNF